MMKAAVIEKFGSPEVFHIGEVQEPVISPNDLLVEVIAGSVNPIDWKQRKGKHRFLFGSPFPIVLGYDVAGKVVKKGISVNRFEIGDRVCGVLNNKYGGGLGQFAKGNQNCFTKVPEKFDLSHAAALPLAGLTALQALRDKGNISSGMKVLIIGAAGGVGHFAQQIAAMYATEIISVSSRAHENFLRQLAKHTLIDYTTTDILSLSDRFDLIFDTVGKYSFPLCRRLLQPKGIYINTLPRPKIVWHKLLSIVSGGKKVKTLLMRHDPDDLAILMKWVVEGKIRIGIDRVFSITKMNEAHAYSEAGHAEGKILILYNWQA
jgi:NADPH:quinone reductase-like Zn-dependent oxidoreductase